MTAWRLLVFPHGAKTQRRNKATRKLASNSMGQSNGLPPAKFNQKADFGLSVWLLVGWFRWVKNLYFRGIPRQTKLEVWAERKFGTDETEPMS